MHHLESCLARRNIMEMITMELELSVELASFGIQYVHAINCFPPKNLELFCIKIFVAMLFSGAWNVVTSGPCIGCLL